VSLIQRYNASLMRAWRRWTIVVALVLLSAGMLLGMFADLGRVRPTLENESVFFRAYDPQDTITYFRVGTGGSRLVGESSDSGYGAASHGRTFEEHYFIKDGDQFAIDQALRNDIRARLKGSHATILNESITPNGEVLFRYVNDHTTGSVTLEPTETGVARRNDTPANASEVQTRVAIKETWTNN
jgi:hypothetical protein